MAVKLPVLRQLVLHRWARAEDQHPTIRNGITPLRLYFRGALLTMVERKSLYTVIVRLSGKRSDWLADALIDRFTVLNGSMKTITFDNGLEFADHERMSEALDARVYFAHPYSSWERGINENTNGLIRQYFPKHTDFTQVSDAEIQFVMDRLIIGPEKPEAEKRRMKCSWGSQSICWLHN